MTLVRGMGILHGMERTEAELIAAVLKGDAASFEPLVEKYSPRVFATARRYARRESEVEDIAQDIWLKAFERLNSFRSEAPFEHWLMRVAVRTCYDALRAHHRNRETIFAELTEPEEDWLDRFVTQPDAAKEDAEAARQLIARVLEQLSPSARLVSAAGQGAGLPGPGRNAQGAGKNGQREVSVTARPNRASEIMQAV